MSLSADYRVIMIPWNYSGNSLLALEKALELAEPASRIHVVHVARPFQGPDNGSLLLVHESRHRCQYRTRFFEELPKGLDDKRIRFSVEFGYVGRELMAAARRIQPDLIVASGSPKQGWIEKLFGDPIAKLEAQLDCPVVTLRQPSRSALHQFVPARDGTVKSNRRGHAAVHAP